MELVEGSGSTSKVHWLVRGRVQGVGFRWFVLQTARRLGLGGDVRNLPDGRVEIRAAGTREALERFRSEVLCGPRTSRVDGIERLEPDASVILRDFAIRH